MFPSEWATCDVSWGEDKKHLYCPDNESLEFQIGTEKMTEPKRFESTAVHNNKWGYRGVEWDSSRRKFRARIEPGNDKRGRWLGYYNSAADAGLSYDNAAREVYGEHAYLNFPEPGEKKCMPSRHSEGLCPRGHNLKEHSHPDPRGISCRLCNNAAQKRWCDRQRIQKVSQ